MNFPKCFLSRISLIYYDEYFRHYRLRMSMLHLNLLHNQRLLYKSCLLRSGSFVELFGKRVCHILINRLSSMTSCLRLRRWLSYRSSHVVYTVRVFQISEYGYLVRLQHPLLRMGRYLEALLQSLVWIYHFLCRVFRCTLQIGFQIHEFHRSKLLLHLHHVQVLMSR